MVSVFLMIYSIAKAQDYITELPKEKNQFFWLLKVKAETIQEENFRTTDSTKVWRKITKNYYDSNGYLIKKEIFDSSFTNPIEVREYKYDKDGNYTEFLLNGELRELREYNDSGKITHTYWYDDEETIGTYFHKYDSVGNEIEILNKHSSGRIDTFLITHYNYDYSVNPPLIKSDTSFYNEQNYREILISELDSIGRCTRLITLRSDSTYNHTTLFYYNERNLFDSTISYSNKGIRKYIREYDNHYRIIKTIHYRETDSIPYIRNYSYDDKIFMQIDSLFQKNNLDLTKNSDFEKTGVTLETSYKDEDEIRVKITTEYYPSGLVRYSTRYDNNFNKVAKNFYEYEFY